MFVLETTCGQEVVLGPYTLRVLHVQRDEVVLALICPDEDGTRHADWRSRTTSAPPQRFASPGDSSGRNGRQPPA
jgi:hypothetical protein